MSALTALRMRDARDAEDARLLSSGDHETLLATYLDAIVGRCFAAIRSADADDVAQNVIERLWRELEDGRTYDVPFRVVVHNVIGWKIKEYFAKRRGDAPLEEADGEDPHDGYGEWETIQDLASLIAELPERQQEVARLRFL